MVYGSSLTSQVASQFRGQGISVSIDKSGSLIIYRREGGFPSGPVEKVIDVPSLDAFYVYPVHSVQPEVSTHLLLKLSRPLVVGPNSSISIYVKVPISAGIYVFGGEAQKLIDSFGFRPYKYALYGTTSNGIVCRFYRTDVFPEVPKTELWEAITRITVENPSDDFVEVKCVVLPILNTMIYVDDMGKAYVEAARMHISKDGLGIVTLGNEPPLPGLKGCPQQFGKLQERTVKFLMEFGF